MTDLPELLRQQYNAATLTLVLGSDLTYNPSPSSRLVDRVLKEGRRFIHDVTPDQLLSLQSIATDASRSLGHSWVFFDIMALETGQCYPEVIKCAFADSVQEGEHHIGEAVKRLNLNIILTTSIADRLDYVFSRYLKFTWRDLKEIYDALKRGKQVLVQLHGNLHQPDTWTFRSAQYRLFKDSSQDLLRLVESTSFLFVGYGEQDPLNLPELTGISDEYWRSGLAQRHYAIVTRPYGERFVDQWRQDWNLYPVYVNHLEEVVTLLDRLGDETDWEALQECERAIASARQMLQPETNESDEHSRAVQKLQILQRQRRVLLDQREQRAAARPLPVLRKGVVLDDRYYLIQRVSEGSFANVWQAERASDSKPVAVKILHPALHRDPVAKSRFVRGAKVLIESPQKGLVPVEDSQLDRVDRHVYFVMPWCEGGNLRDLVLRQGPVGFPQLSLSDIIEIVRTVADCLQTLHDRGIFHRDIHPANILILRTGVGKFVSLLTDFDLVYHLEQKGLTLHETFAGAPSFIAPELFTSGVKIDALAEIYSLAATLVFALTGQEPKQGLSLSEQGDLVQLLPADLRPVLTIAMSREPSRRYSSMTKLSEALSLPSPRKRLVEVLDHMRRLQGTLCKVTDIDALATSQITAFAGVFTHATHLETLWAYGGPGAPIPPKNLDYGMLDAPHVWSIAVEVVQIMRRLRIDLVRAPQPAITDALNELNRLVIRHGQLMERRPREHVDSLDMPQRLGADERLFCEYLVGLGLCEAFIYVGHLLAEWDRSERGVPSLGFSTYERGTYIGGLQKAFDLHNDVLDYFRVWFRAKNRRKLWLRIHTYWLVCMTPGLREAILRTVSLRALPSGEGQLLPDAGCEYYPAQLLTLAQIGHWEGWGGVGSIFTQMEIYGRNALTRLLADNRSHTFDWHQTAQFESGANFSHRKDFFAPPAVILGDYAAGMTAVLLLHPNVSGRHHFKNDTARIWGDAVGPKRIAEGRIIQNLEIAANYLRLSPVDRFELVLTEASAPSMKALTSGNDLRETRHLVWRDLNIPFPGEPGQTSQCDQGNGQSLIQAGTYDCYSCSMSLHQVGDATQRGYRIQALMAFACRVVRVGGIVSIPDVGGGVALQAFLLPTNIVDREGGWCGSFYDLIREGCRVCRFQDVAFVEAEGCYLSDIGVERRAPDLLVKVPLPLYDLHRGSPVVGVDEVPSLPPRSTEGLLPYVYEYIPYLVASVPLQCVEQLDGIWLSATPMARCDSVADILEGWRPGITDALSECLTIVQRMGYELAEVDASPSRVRLSRDGHWSDAVMAPE